MINYLNEIDKINFPIIISGGIQSSLDAHFLMTKCIHPSIYGSASRILKYALKGHDELEKFLELEIESFKIAKSLTSAKQ